MRTSQLKSHRTIPTKCGYCGDIFPLETYRYGKHDQYFCSQRCKGGWSYDNLLKEMFNQSGISPPNKKFKNAVERGRWWGNHYRSTTKGKLTVNLRAHLNYAMKKGGVYNKKGKHWEEIIGYSIETLIEHIESQFTKDMTWENYGKWHIDHIIPIVAFNYLSCDDLDFKKCWSLENLRPMWAHDNQSKNCRLEKPFQPSLAIAL